MVTTELKGPRIESAINSLLEHHSVPARVSVSVGIGMNLVVEVSSGAKEDSEWGAAVNQMVMRVISGVLEKESLEPERFPWISWKS